jgi:hypothetical protein
MEPLSIMYAFIVAITICALVAIFAMNVQLCQKDREIAGLTRKIKELEANRGK